jgi:hypothetical protein
MSISIRSPKNKQNDWILVGSKPPDAATSAREVDDEDASTIRVVIAPAAGGDGESADDRTPQASYSSDPFIPALGARPRRYQRL